MKVKNTFFDELLVNIGELFTIRSVLKYYLGPDADMGQRDGLQKLSKSIDNLYNTVLKGKGTTTTTCLPLTVSIMKIFLVHLGKDVFGIPLSKVMHVVGADNTTKTTYGGEAMPVFFLRNLLGINKDQPVKDEQIVIVRTDEKIVGIRIDGFCEEVDAYIRPLVSPLSEVKGTSGFTILGDGRPVFILDIDDLLE